MQGHSLARSRSSSAASFLCNRAPMSQGRGSGGADTIPPRLPLQPSCVPPAWRPCPEWTLSITRRAPRQRRPHLDCVHALVDAGHLQLQALHLGLIPSKLLERVVPRVAQWLGFVRARPKNHNAPAERATRERVSLSAASTAPWFSSSSLICARSGCSGLTATSSIVRSTSHRQHPTTPSSCVHCLTMPGSGNWNER